MFQVQDISVRKGGKLLLKPVNLEVKPGHAMAVLGPNGAGKSLLLRASALIEDGASGQVTLGARSWSYPTPMDGEGPWPALTIVLQSLALWPHLTGRGNIETPIRSASPVTARFDEMERLMTALDVHEVADRRPAAMSGGQRQRVALVRALVMQSQVLILDEPTSALDSGHAERLLNELLGQKQRGTCILFATHSLGFAMRLADRFAFIMDGALVRTGVWAQLFNASEPAIREYLRLEGWMNGADSNDEYRAG